MPDVKPKELPSSQWIDKTSIIFQSLERIPFYKWIFVICMMVFAWVGGGAADSGNVNSIFDIGKVTFYYSVSVVAFCWLIKGRFTDYEPNDRKNVTSNYKTTSSTEKLK